MIIPVYNAEKYLGECLDSVRSQTLSDIEVICVNDGSSDDSLNLLKSYKEKDREKIKPIIEKIKTNREEMRKVKFDPTISRSEKEKKIEKLQKERKSLKDKANKCREENMKNFESVLTPEQKEEFEKIKAEQRKQMEERRKEFVKKNDRQPPIHQEVMPLK